MVAVEDLRKVVEELRNVKHRTDEVTDGLKEVIAVGAKGSNATGTAFKKMYTELNKLKYEVTQGLSDLKTKMDEVTTGLSDCKARVTQ